MSLLRKLFDFHGGVKPAGHKHLSSESPIRVAALPSRLVVPLHQGAGSTARPLVQAGQKVLKGERIAAPDGNFSTAIHAPSSGLVRAIEPATLPHASGLADLAVIIEPDGEERWAPLEAVNPFSLAPDELRDWLRDAGIVGMGGAGFPTHIKLRPSAQRATRTLILNGAECEPYITCDDRLMRERATEILRGAAIMRHLLQADEILIGIEDNKPEAIAAMEAAAATQSESCTVVAIPTRYPAGGVRQLVRVLTGIEVPHGALPTDFGVQCFNVGTALAVHEAVDLGRPLISRVVTVTGNVAQPGNFQALIGTPMNELVAQAGPGADTDRYIMGGPMMGVPMPALDVPVTKGCNCILVASPTLFPPAPPEMPCIRCGECAKVCPADLQPFELYWFSRARNFGKAQEYHLFDCIECGCCSYVCPAHIPLVDYYRFAKSEIWARERDKKAADQARERFEFRNERQEREKREKAERLAAKAAATREKLAEAGGTDVAPAEADNAKKALVAAALARARQQKETVQPRNTTDLPPEAAAEIARIDARRQQAGLPDGGAPADAAKD